MAVKLAYKIVPEIGDLKTVSDSSYMNAGQDQMSASYNAMSWLTRLMSGSYSRLGKYVEYDTMDSDIDINNALDIIAEEICSNVNKTMTPLEIVTNTSFGDRIDGNTINTLNIALMNFTKIHDLDSRMFDIARLTVKYGDCFFYVKDGKSTSPWVFIHPKHVEGAIIANDNIHKIIGWKIDPSFLTLDRNGSPLSVDDSITKDHPNGLFSAHEIIRFTLNDDMSEMAPFGISVLSPIWRTFRQKELLEDAILIYRIVRAPEKRVFRIDVTGLHSAKVAAYLEQFKADIKQKKVPTAASGDRFTVNSIYDAMSTNEDFFFAKNANGGGSEVDTLNSGQNLGDLEDLDYFYKKMLKGMKVPLSYTDPSAVNNDGKVGIAYLQEVKFYQFISRLQKKIQKTLDSEFKKFLKELGVSVDPSMFQVSLREPSNWAKSRQQAIDNDLLNTYSSADGISHLSRRFALQKYLQLTPEEIALNEKMLKEEKGLDPESTSLADLPKIYFPEEAEAGGFEGGLAHFGSDGYGKKSTPEDIPNDNKANAEEQE